MLAAHVRRGSARLLLPQDPDDLLFLEAIIYTRKGHDLTKRLPAIAALAGALPTRSCILDAELTACDEQGLPDLWAFHSRDAWKGKLCEWASNLFEHEWP
jgi:hypothetical protein